MRTSLVHIPSAFTEDQQQAHREAYEREMFHRHNAGVVRLDDLSWPWEVRMAVEARLTQRFGKRG